MRLPIGKKQINPECTPEFEKKLLREADKHTERAAQEMASSVDRPSRRKFSSERDSAIRAFEKLEESCGGINLPSAITGKKTYHNPEEAFKDAFDYYKDRYDRESLRKKPKRDNYQKPKEENYDEE